MEPPAATRPNALDLLRMFWADRGDPNLARALAERAVQSLPDVANARVLDVGCGPGLYAAQLEARGADVVALELDPFELGNAEGAPYRPVIGDGCRLPFRNASFDAVLCSNMLEHTPSPHSVLGEIERILCEGAWAYISWTNWLSPWGGHAIAPLHYLGPDRGTRTYRRLFGEPTGNNMPFDGVWPLHIRDVLDYLDRQPGLHVDSVEPRYYPWLRPVMRVRGLREVVAWNCKIIVRRVHSSP